MAMSRTHSISKTQSTLSYCRTMPIHSNYSPLPSYFQDGNCSPNDCALFSLQNQCKLLSSWNASSPKPTPMPAPSTSGLILHQPHAGYSRTRQQKLVSTTTTPEEKAVLTIQHAVPRHQKSHQAGNRLLLFSGMSMAYLTQTHLNPAAMVC
jgi:hypothetical protein